MKIRITFERPYFEEATILALTSHDLDDFYVEANEVDRLNLFFMPFLHPGCIFDDCRFFLAESAFLIFNNRMRTHSDLELLLKLL